MNLWEAELAAHTHFLVSLSPKPVIRLGGAVVAHQRAESLRADILEWLRENGRSKANQVAEGLGITDITAITHMRRLVDDGLVVIHRLKCGWLEWEAT